MPDRAGSRTPKAPRKRGVGEPILSSVDDDSRASARPLRSAKLGAPHLLGPARSGMVGWKNLKKRTHGAVADSVGRREPRPHKITRNALPGAPPSGAAERHAPEPALVGSTGIAPARAIRRSPLRGRCSRAALSTASRWETGPGAEGRLPRRRAGAGPVSRRGSRSPRTRPDHPALRRAQGWRRACGGTELGRG